MVRYIHIPVDENKHQELERTKEKEDLTWLQMMEKAQEKIKQKA